MSASTSVSRIRELASVLRGINDGTVPDEDARRVLRNIDPVELSLAEQQLIHDGVAPEQLRRLCVAHMKVLERERRKTSSPPWAKVTRFTLSSLSTSSSWASWIP